MWVALLPGWIPNFFINIKEQNKHTLYTTIFERQYYTKTEHQEIHKNFTFNFPNPCGALELTSGIQMPKHRD